MSIIIKRAPVPASVPAAFLHGVQHVTGSRRPIFRDPVLPCPATERCKRIGRDDHEPAEPDAFPATFITDTVHTVVPVTRPYQRKSVLAAGISAFQCALAMVKDTVTLLCPFKFGISVLFFRRQFGRT